MLKECAEVARGGMFSAVVVEGEAGIGKTWLVRRALDQLAGFVVWWAGCDAAERDWPFGVVDQWLRRVEGSAREGFSLLAGRLPARGAGVEVAAQLVGLLGEVQESTPVVLVVDDVQWADEASLTVLGFLLRRLWADRVLLVVVARSGSGAGGPVEARVGDEAWRRPLARAPHARVVRLGGLAEAEVAQLAVAAGVGAGAAGRLMDHTGGHPLYVTSVLSAAPPQVWADTRAALPVPTSLAGVVRATLAGLDADGRALVEALAVLDAPVPLARAGRTAEIADPAGALESVLASGLVRWWPTEPTSPVRIRHALQRDAVYEAMDPGRRRALHATAAGLVDRDASWAHRVAAAQHADPALADELEEEAGRLRAVGQLGRSATLLLWAGDLSGTWAEHERRLLTAAVNMYRWPYGGDTRRSAVQDGVRQCAPSALRSCLLGRFSTVQFRYAEGERHFREAIAAARADGDQATGALARAWLAALYYWQGERPELALQLAREVLEGEPDPPTRLQALIAFLVASVQLFGSPAALAEIKEVVGLPDDPAQAAPEDGLLLTYRGRIRVLGGQLADGRRDIVAALAREQPETGISLFQAHLILAECHYWAGEWDQAAASCERLLAQLTVGGISVNRPEVHALAAAVAAGRGHWDTAGHHLRDCQEWARKAASAYADIYPILAETVIAEARTDAVGMLRALAPLENAPETVGLRSCRFRIVPLQVQAFIGAGRFDQAAAALVDLHTLARYAPALRIAEAWALGRLAESHHDVQAALTAYRQGLAEPVTADDIPLHRARLEHAYGRLLGALGEKRKATEALHSAHSRYAALGATPFAERVTQDLETHSRHPTTHTRTDRLADLTEREETIARLAASGMTNQEIAADLYISAKTVEYHLGHVFTKLRLTSRRQLRTALV